MWQQRLARCLAAGVLAAAGWACDSATGLERVPAEIAITAPALALRLGATLQLTAAVFDRGGAPLTGPRVSWSSDQPGVAAVDSTGRVTGLALGTATIRATAASATAQVDVEVLAVPVHGVQINLAFELHEGDLVQLQASARDSAGGLLEGRPFTYETSNPAIATVSATGLISALAAGNVTFTVRSEGAAGSVAKTVAGLRVSWGPTPCLQVDRGATCQTWANVRYASGSGNIIPSLSAQVTYASSDETVVSVGTSPRCTSPDVCSPYANIRGVAPGQATVTARYAAPNGLVRTDLMPVTVR